MRPLGTVFSVLGDSRARGLSDSAVEESRARFGSNRLTPPPQVSPWRKLLEKFDDAILKILLVATLLKTFVDLFEASAIAGGIAFGCSGVLFGVFFALRWKLVIPAAAFALGIALFGLSCVLGAPSVEGLAVLTAVALAAGVSFLSERRSDREFEKLDAAKGDLRAKVIRDGRPRVVPAEEIAVGDLVRLEAGDEIPADGRVVLGSALVDQSLMTGESVPASKEPSATSTNDDALDASDCLYRGTHIAEGHLEMIVADVGDDTMLGQIARKLGAEPEEESHESERVRRRLTTSRDFTPLQQELAELAGTISRVGYAAAVAIFLALIVRGMVATPREIFLPTTASEGAVVARNLLSALVYMVVIIVVAVPEGLPMSVTISLALAMRKMTRARALVRTMNACETIGAVDVVCTDKTGTLTQNRMRLERISAGGKRRERSADGILDYRLPATLGEPSPWEWIAFNALHNATASVDAVRQTPIGNPTESALLVPLKVNEIDAARKEFPLLKRVPFSGDRKRMETTLSRSGEVIHLVKGAPEAILTLASVEARERVFYDDELRDAAVNGMRTLGFAHAIGEGPWVFDGLVSVRDPLREDVPAAIARCQRAGVAVVMITGDDSATATAIATAAGLVEADSWILAAPEFEALSDDEIRVRLPKLRVLARAKPLDKYRLVRLFQESGKVVAMTGDGTNDAPSLKRADVGLAMGASGTEAAKEASRIVLLDDSFATIVNAILWGRSLHENIKKFLAFQLTVNLSALAVAFLGPILGFRPPFTVIQLLWINVVMDAFAALALCSEPPREELLLQPPRGRGKSIVGRSLFFRIAGTALIFTITTLGLLCVMHGTADHVGFLGDLTSPRLISDGATERVVSPSELVLTATGWSLPGPDDTLRSVHSDFTLRQATFFFTFYVFLQIGNLVNCRSLTRGSALRGLSKNPYFLAIVAVTLLVQWLIVTFGSTIFRTEPLAFSDWLLALGAGLLVLVAGELLRLLLPPLQAPQ